MWVLEGSLGDSDWGEDDLQKPVLQATCKAIRNVLILTCLKVQYRRSQHGLSETHGPTFWDAVSV